MFMAENINIILLKLSDNLFPHYIYNNILSSILYTLFVFHLRVWPCKMNARFQDIDTWKTLIGTFWDEGKMFHGNVAINVFMVYVSLLRILKCCYCWFFVQSNNFNHMVQNASPLLIEKKQKRKPCVIPKCN